MQFVLDCFTMVVSAVLCFSFLHNKYKTNDVNLAVRIAVITCIIGVKIGVVLLQIPPLNLITAWILYFSIIYVSYKCLLKEVLMYSFIFLMIALVADALGVLIVSAFYNHAITETIVGATDLVWHHHLWNWIVQIFLSRITASLIRKDNNLQSKWHELAFYIILIIFEIIFFACVSTAIQDYMSGQFLIFVMSGFMVLDIYIMYMIHKISLAREIEQKVNLMQQQEQLQHQMYRELREKYNITREISHDINRHINSLESLIADKPIEKAERYISDLIKETERLKPYIKNQNAMLEIILNTISDRCEKEHILLELNIEDFKMDFISDMDITTIFSNLLDNAIDACMEIPRSERKIHVVIRKQIGLIVFRITNPCKNSLIHMLPNNTSTKLNHSGIGLSNVKKAVKKYNGIINISHEENQFCVSITFNK
ncbi:MAG: ATP-binding protein [Clostridium sp.]|nr:ATP-binding protein [Clostridium sp.]